MFKTRIPFLAGIATGIYAIETLIPKPLPWLRLGLSNAVVLCVLATFGFKYGLLVSIVRTTVGSFITGMFLTPFFFFGLSGGIVSTCVMWIAYTGWKKIFSLIGISILGALAHNITQFFLAYVMFIKRVEVFYLLPVFILLSLVAGTITGFGAIYLKRIFTPAFVSG